MNEIVLHTPAKLNLALDVAGVNQNGYHLLDMVMQSVAIYDTVTLRRTPQGIALESEGSSPKGLENIAVQAALRLQHYAGVDQGAVITLDKGIPMQAGMGGGSADAAAVLLGLNQLWRLHLTMEELERIGLQLGADVPFALRGGTARARGIGEKLTALRPGGLLHFVCAKNRGGLSTPAVYHGYDQIARGTPPYDMDAFCTALEAGEWEKLREVGGNALEKAAFALCPAIEPLIGRMYDAGAAYAHMTGSGAAVFGMFTAKDAALQAMAALNGCADWMAYAPTCQGVS